MQGKLNALTERLSELPSEMDASPIYQQMQKISLDKMELEQKILEAKKKGDAFEMPVELTEYQNFLEMLRAEAIRAITPELKQKILTKVIEKVELLSDGMRIHFVVSSGKIKRGSDKTGPLFKQPQKNAVMCSNSLTNGGTNRT